MIVNNLRFILVNSYAVGKKSKCLIIKAAQSYTITWA